MMNLHYRGILEKIEVVLARTLARTDPSPGGTPADYRPLREPAEDLLARGGKRWRPVLLCLSCELLGGTGEALELTPLVEFPHSGSLILDDLEDNSDIRRGKPAAHILYGADTAINSGCFLYFLPLSLLEESGLSGDLRLRLYRYYGQALRSLHLGQSLDIAWHRDRDFIPAPGEYFFMGRHKTGALARLAGLAGAAAAGAAEEEGERLGRLWEDFGLAFQILDDVTNLRQGNPGKNRGDDIVEGKKSLPLIYACRSLEERGASGQEVLRRLRELLGQCGLKGFKDSRDLVEEAAALIEQTGGPDRAEEEAQEILKAVRQEVLSLFPPSPAREAVLDLSYSLG
jgi:octaprenyl-diphosphate synthase